MYCAVILRRERRIYRVSDRGHWGLVGGRGLHHRGQMPAGTLQVSQRTHSDLEQKGHQNPNGSAPYKEAACGG